MSCPCLLIEPCSYACSCAHPYMSGGCQRCVQYGDMNQRIAKAQWIADAIEQKKRVGVPPPGKEPIGSIKTGIYFPFPRWLQRILKV